jgi:sugar phosphate isomerase/epimerase
MQIKLGCFSRPWTNYDVETAMQGTVQAGFTYFGFMTSKGGVPLPPKAPPEQVEHLAGLLARYRLVNLENYTQINWKAEQEARAGLRSYVDNSLYLGARYLHNSGTSDEALYDRFLQLMEETAEYAKSKGVVVMMKPHGGVTATARGLVQLMKRIRSDNLKVFYDPGNVLYYTGERPEDGFEELAPYVAGMSIKDEVGGIKGSVNVTPGDGDVDFKKLFTILKAHDFSGPCLIEQLGGTTVAEINREAVRAREYLLRLFDALGATVE